MVYLYFGSCVRLSCSLIDKNVRYNIPPIQVDSGTIDKYCVVIGMVRKDTSK